MLELYYMISSCKNRGLLPHALRQGSPRDGFALVIALASMSFVLLVLLLIVTLVRVESNSSAQQLLQLQARQNALLGVMIALGELQQHAGPDQRVSARAEILGTLEADDPRRFWTGVWDTRDMSAPPRWLVSGLEVDAAVEDALLDETAVALILGAEQFGNAEVDQYVFAPKIVTQLSTIHRQSMAFWISDEGVKASVAPLFESTRIVNNSDLTDDAFIRLARQRTGFTAAKPDFLSTETFQETEALGFRIHSMTELPLAWANSPSGDAWVEALAAHLHDYTGRHYGLLVDTINGGLRKDLSAIHRLSPDLNAAGDAWINAAVQHGLRIWTVIDDGVLEPTVIRGSNSTDDPSLKFTPVITEFFLGTALSGNAATQASTEVFMYYYIFAELWNPFTKALNFSPRHQYDDIIVRVRGLPSVELTNTTTGASTTIALPDLIFDIDFYDFIDGAEQDRFVPGRITWTGNPAASGSGQIEVEGQVHLRRNGTYIIEVPVGHITGTTVEDFKGEFSASDLTIEFYLKREGFEHAGQPHELFWTMAIENFDAFEREYIGGSGTPSNYTPSPSQFFRPRNSAAHGLNRTSTNNARNSFSYYFRIGEEAFSPGSDDFRLMRDVNAIQRDVTSFDLVGPFEGLNQLYEVRAFPHEVQRGPKFSELDFFSGKDNPGDSAPERWAYMIDIPDQAPVELTQLNFLTFSEDNYEKIGYTNSSDLNRLYDQYFLSGFVADIPDRPLEIYDLMPNPRYRLNNPSVLSDYAQLAGGLNVVGAFNVNSTSARAWAGVLSGSNMLEWPLQPEADLAAREDFPNAFFNLPNFGNRGFTPVFSQDNAFTLPLREGFSGTRDIANFMLDNISHQTPLPPAFRQGLREVNDTIRLALATQIRELIIERGKPFASLREFWDSGIVQQAIDAVETLNTDEDGNRIPQLSPADFNQITVATNVGSRLSARSDTFNIIGYGEVENLMTGNQITARCEVSVQRIAEDLNGTLSADASERRFVITHFKWLD